MEEATKETENERRKREREEKDRRLPQEIQEKIQKQREVVRKLEDELKASKTSQPNAVKKHKELSERLQLARKQIHYYREGTHTCHATPHTVCTPHRTIPHTLHTLRTPRTFFQARQRRQSCANHVWLRVTIQGKDM